MNEIELTNIQKLVMLRNHLIKMDSGSGDAQLLSWAIRKIERATKIGGILCRGYRGRSGVYGRELYFDDK